jgi:hypothetical protein
MSRSYRRPFATITGNASAKDDKRLAHRGVRRKQNQTLETCVDYEELLLPHRPECAWNEVWCWGRDGAQFYCGDDRYSDSVSSREYYRKLLRK